MNALYWCHNFPNSQKEEISCQPVTKYVKRCSPLEMISGSKTMMVEGFSKVDGKALRLRKTLIFEDMDGNKLCQIQERWLPIKETMAIDGPDGEQIAVVKKALIAPLSDRWSSMSKTGQTWMCKATSLTMSIRSRRGGIRSRRYRRNGSALQILMVWRLTPVRMTS